VLDSHGDDCSWYSDAGQLNPPRCGNFDTRDFRAHDMCCACGGGSATPGLISAVSICVDTNHELRDSQGDNCDRYIGYEDTCGSFDEDLGFNAAEMCCSCGGGEP